LPDGGRLAARLDAPAGAGDRPLVVLIHGLTGSERSVNIVRTAQYLTGEGWPVLRLNLRGTAPSRATAAGRYHAGKTDDLASALRALPDALAARGVALVGHSLGGNLVLKYMGEGADARVRGAVAVSAPLDLAATSRRMEAPRNIVYHRYLLSELKREAFLPGAALSDAQRKAIRAARSIRAFDDGFVAPMFGFDGAEDYYARNSSGVFLRSIERPTLLVHALDDPWIPAALYEAIDWAGLAAVDTAFAPGGGHLGFHDRGGAVGWHDRVTAAWLRRNFGAQ
jgi:predicted alpha/beta-fold hydrolase